MSALDVRVEKELRRALRRLDPEAGFLGEETGHHRGRSRRTWIVDPIDGTSNFAAGVPIWCVAVALFEEGAPVVAACFEARGRRTLFAARGEGAWRLGGARLRRTTKPCSRWGPLGLVGVLWRRRRTGRTLVERLVGIPCKLRVLGSSVAHLLSVAEGQWAAVAQDRGRLWDVAAAGLVAMEAGAEVVDLRGRPLFPMPTGAVRRGAADRPLLAGSPEAVAALLRRLRRRS